MSERKNIIWSVVNLLITVGLIYWNYLSNTGIINGKTIGSLSNKYDNLFVPAPYTFAIWGIIFIALIIYAINAVRLAYSMDPTNMDSLKVLPYLTLANVLNGVWVWFWLHEAIFISVIIMVLLLLALLKIVIDLRMELWDAPLKTIALVWWPIDLYAGWISVATVANITAYLKSIEFSLGMSEVTWVIILIGVVTLINYLMIQKRNMREFAVVGIWALIGIAVKHWDVLPSLQWTAVGGASILAFALAIHAFKNRSTAPFLVKKWKNDF